MQSTADLAPEGGDIFDTGHHYNTIDITVSPLYFLYFELHLALFFLHYFLRQGFVALVLVDQVFYLRLCLKKLAVQPLNFAPGAGEMRTF